MSRQAPSDRQLLRWLDRNPARLETHLAEFPDDAARLDRLTTAPGLGERLGDTLRPPADLLERLAVPMRGDTSRRETTELIVDLLGTAWRTATVLFTEEESMTTHIEGITP